MDIQQNLKDVNSNIDETRGIMMRELDSISSSMKTIPVKKR